MLLLLLTMKKLTLIQMMRIMVQVAAEAEVEVEVVAEAEVAVPEEIIRKIIRKADTDARLVVTSTEQDAIEYSESMT